MQTKIYFITQVRLFQVQLKFAFSIRQYTKVI